MVALSEAYKENPLLHHQIIPLDFASAVSDLPETHDWSLSDISEFTPSSGDRRLSPPVVDLSDPDSAALMSRAFEEWGAFLLTGHGVPADLTAEVEAHTRRLFALPMESKLRALRSPSGATGYGVALISPFFSKHMWHEGFTIMGSPKDHAKELWPCGGYERFCEVMEEYEKQMKKLITEKLLPIFLNPTQQLNTSDEPCSALQLNSYPECPVPDRAMGLAPHTDTFLLTVVHQINCGGELQLLKDGNNVEEDGPRWVPVPAMPGALVVNAGDLLHIMSNGRYRSVVHRVAVSQRQRYSLAYFYGPPLDYTLCPNCSEGEALFKSLTVKEYVGIKGKNLDKALSFVRI